MNAQQIEEVLEFIPSNSDISGIMILTNYNDCHGRSIPAQDTSSDSELEELKELPVAIKEVPEAPATIEEVPDKVSDALEDAPYSIDGH